MEKNTFATIGILAVLLLSFTVVSAAQFTFTSTTAVQSSATLGEVITGIGYSLNYDEATYEINLDFSTNDAHWSDLDAATDYASTDSPITGTATLKIPDDYTGYTFETTLKARVTNITEIPSGEDFAHTYSFPISIIIPENADANPPVITLLGDATVEVTVGNTYTDAGATATDDEDGDLTLDIVVGGDTVDTSTIGTYTITYDVDDSADNSAVQVTRNVQVTPSSSTDYSFCKSGEIGTLEIKDFSVDNFGEGDDDAWELLDRLEIEVEVKNTDTAEDVKGVMVAIKVLDNEDRDVTDDFDFEDTELKIGRIRDGEKETVLFEIDELPADLDDVFYKILVKAYSDDDEDLQCVDSDVDELSDTTYHSIEIIREEDPAVVIKESELSKISASCGNDVSTSFYIYNIGSDKEEKVLVVLGNSELGISEKIVVDNLKSGKRKEVAFNFEIPEDLTKPSYKLKVATYFDYDEDEDELKLNSYGEDSDEIDQDYDIELEILNCGAAPSITADLASDTIVGEELVIKATITNNGDDNDFIVSASGFESWAKLVSVSPQTTSIDGEDSEEVIITLMPTKAGSQSFKIEAIVDGEKTSQSVSVSISEDEGAFSEISNTMLYTIIGIIAVLILIFLVLIVRVSRRAPKPQF